MKHLLATLAVLVLLGSTAFAARTISVPGDCATIQEAIDSASPGDTVSVAPGIYSHNTNGEQFPITLRDGVSLIGRDPKTTILDAVNVSRVVDAIDLESSETRIDGFTLRGGNVENAETNENGGGAILSDNSAIVISNNVIEDNAAVHGGAILARGRRAPVIAGNLILRNRVPFSGLGAAILIDSCRAEVVNNIIARNETGRGDITVINSAPLIINNTIFGDTRQGNISTGIHLTANGDPVIANNIIAFHQDIGILEEDGDSDPVLRHNLFHENRTDYQDEGETRFKGPQLELHVDNGENEVVGNVFGPVSFAAADRDDYHILGLSAAVDAGDNSVIGLPPVDFEGDDRILASTQGGPLIVDIGADEFNPGPATSTTSYQVVEQGPSQTVTTTQREVIYETRYIYRDVPRYSYAHYYYDYPLYDTYYDWWPDYYYVSVWWPHRRYCYYPYFTYCRTCDKHYSGRHDHDRDRYDRDGHRDRYDDNWDNNDGRGGGRNNDSRQASTDSPSDRLNNPRAGTNDTRVITRDDTGKAAGDRTRMLRSSVAVTERAATSKEVADYRTSSNKLDRERDNEALSRRSGAGYISDQAPRSSAQSVPTRGTTGSAVSSSRDNSTVVYGGNTYTSRSSSDYPMPARRTGTVYTRPSAGGTSTGTRGGGAVYGLETSRRQTYTPPSDPPAVTERQTSTPATIERRTTTEAPRTYSPPASSRSISEAVRSAPRRPTVNYSSPPQVIEVKPEPEERAPQSSSLSEALRSRSGGAVSSRSSRSNEGSASSSRSGRGAVNRR